MGAEAVNSTGRHDPSVAQACFARLGRQYIQSCLAKREHWQLPREADEIGFACLLLCHEHGRLLDKGASEVIQECRATALQSSQCIRWLEWIDGMVWNCCLEILESGNLCGDEVSGVLIENLTHHQSSVRRDKPARLL